MHEYTGLSVPVCAYTGLSVPVCAYTGLSVPVCAYTGLSVPVCACTGLSILVCAYTGLSVPVCAYTGLSVPVCAYSIRFRRPHATRVSLCQSPCAAVRDGRRTVKSSAQLCDLLDAPTALAACCEFDQCRSFVLKNPDRCVRYVCLTVAPRHMSRTGGIFLSHPALIVPRERYQGIVSAGNRTCLRQL